MPRAMAGVGLARTFSPAHALPVKEQTVTSETAETIVDRFRRDTQIASDLTVGVLGFAVHPFHGKGL